MCFPASRQPENCQVSKVLTVEITARGKQVTLHSSASSLEKDEALPKGADINRKRRSMRTIIKLAHKS